MVKTGQQKLFLEMMIREDREFFLMTCIMVKNLQTPCIFIYPVIWNNIFQQYFGKREHKYISEEYNEISNAQKDFKITYLLL